MIDQSVDGKLHDRNTEEFWALLEDLALHDNKSWNDPRDFAKPFKAISLPQDVSSKSYHRLIELEYQVQCLMESYIAPIQPTQVNKITSSCEICSGPHDTRYYMVNPEQAFVDYASSHTDKAGVLCNSSESNTEYDVFSFLDTAYKFFSNQYNVKMEDPNITMEEYTRLEEEKACRRGKVYNWETATYGKIWYDEDVHNHRSVETEFPAIVFNDALTSEVTLPCEPIVSPLNDNEIDFRISFDESDDED
ncbi:hypothetical protein Tco_1562542 [Tanacetum coccineum]